MTERIILRISKEHKFIIAKRAKLRGMTTGEYVRFIATRAARQDWGFEG